MQKDQKNAKAKEKKKKNQKQECGIFSSSALLKTHL